MLTDLYLLTPRRLTRAVLRWLHLSDGVHEFLCGAGLCPCGVDLDCGEEDLAPPATAVA